MSSIPFFLLGRFFHPVPLGSLHYAFHISLHTLLVQAIQLETVGWWRAGGASAGDSLDCVESVNEDSVYKRAAS